jgi:hypothetical protein
LKNCTFSNEQFSFRVGGKNNEVGRVTAHILGVYFFMPIQDKGHMVGVIGGQGTAPRHLITPLKNTNFNRVGISLLAKSENL